VIAGGKVNRYSTFLLLVIGLLTLSSRAQKKPAPCTLQFSLAERDALGNVNLGFSPDGKKWFEKTLAKQYPNVCYADQKANEGIWLYISVSTQSQDSATATTRTTPDGVGGTTSHTTVTPQTTAYPIYTLKIGRFHDGALEVLRTFQHAKVPSGGTVTGLIRSFSNPEHDVITDAVDWLSASNTINPQPAP
jgi:hypothetical protein